MNVIFEFAVTCIIVLLPLFLSIAFDALDEKKQ